MSRGAGMAARSTFFNDADALYSDLLAENCCAPMR
jgi:hypothetical protein